MVAFEVEDYNDGITFSGSTYTASEIGLYHFDVLVTWSLVSVGAASSYTINILKSGTVQNFHTIKIPAGTTGGYSQQISCDMKLSIGSTVTVEVFQNSGISQNLAVGRGVYFSGHRVY